ncbi:hypothetical protein [Methylobacterium sp. D54C]
MRAAAEAPNLVAGLGHAGTPPTALNAVAARSEPPPTAAAMLVRRLVEATGVRAERALAAFDSALVEDLEAMLEIEMVSSDLAEIDDVSMSSINSLRQPCQSGYAAALMRFRAPGDVMRSSRRFRPLLRSVASGTR